MSPRTDTPCLRFADGPQRLRASLHERTLLNFAVILGQQPPCLHGHINTWAHKFCCSALGHRNRNATGMPTSGAELEFCLPLNTGFDAQRLV